MEYRFAVTFAVAASLYAAQKFDVKIVNRQTSESEYAYVVAGSSQTNTTANAACNGSVNGAICSGTAKSTTSTIPSQVRSYSVTGATLTLQLPDGRLAVVNCASKLNITDFSSSAPRRSCRIPPVDDIQAEFDGNSAKLKWSVSIDGKKTQSETFKVIAVLDKP